MCVRAASAGAGPDARPRGGCADLPSAAPLPTTFDAHDAHLYARDGHQPGTPFAQHLGGRGGRATEPQARGTTKASTAIAANSSVRYEIENLYSRIAPAVEPSSDAPCRHSR